MKSTHFVLSLLALWATTQAQANLVVNGGFEDAPGLTTDDTVVIYPDSLLPGWHSVLGSGIEVQQNIPKVGPSFEGIHHAEMDSYNNSNAWQDVATTPGQLYQFSFAYSPLPHLWEDSNIIRYSFGSLGGVITAQGGATTQWYVVTSQTIATSSSTRVYFEALGVSDSGGGLIDSVSVIAVPEPEIYALFGLGLGMGILVRRSKRLRRSS